MCERVRFRPIADIWNASKYELMRRLILLLTLLQVSCSQQQASLSGEETKRVRSDQTRQDKRCSEPVATAFKPDQFDYGVVSTPKVAKETATSYFRAMFADTDIPVNEVLERPLKARLKDGVWHVETTLPEGASGVGFIAELCQSNGRVLTLTGYQ